MKICSACGHALTPDGPCGFASITLPISIGVTVVDKTTYLCHADDHSCYMGAAADPGKVTDDTVRDLAAPSNGSISSRPSPGVDPRVEVAAEQTPEAWSAPDGTCWLFVAESGDWTGWEPGVDGVWIKTSTEMDESYPNHPQNAEPSPAADPRVEPLASYWDGTYGDDAADWATI